MCLASSLWARVDHVYFGADRHDAADAGFDDAAFYGYFDTAPEERSMPVTQLITAETSHIAPFDAWRALDTRIEY